LPFLQEGQQGRIRRGEGFRAEEPESEPAYRRGSQRRAGQRTADAVDDELDALVFGNPQDAILQALRVLNRFAIQRSRGGWRSAIGSRARSDTDIALKRLHEDHIGVAYCHKA
jgi:uncharacterized protein YfaQ (DUF2300 family)